ncbi:hypothetical protein UYO_1753 [Lachnospiraceae bacterium JC7]|nr:hypothetical protein UYO_1753 [Lachnospiraceae bacterium JC7]
MCLTEHDEKTFVNGIKEEGREEGRIEGRDSERRELITKLIKRGKTPEEISDLCGYSMEHIEVVLDEAEEKLAYEEKRIALIARYVEAKKNGEELPELAPKEVIEIRSKYEL